MPQTIAYLLLFFFFKYHWCSDFFCLKSCCLLIDSPDQTQPSWNPCLKVRFPALYSPCLFFPCLSLFLHLHYLKVSKSPQAYLFVWFWLFPTVLQVFLLTLPFLCSSVSLLFFSLTLILSTMVLSVLTFLTTSFGEPSVRIKRWHFLICHWSWAITTRLLIELCFW